MRPISKLTRRICFLLLGIVSVSVCAWGWFRWTENTRRYMRGPFRRVQSDLTVLYRSAYRYRLTHDDELPASLEDLIRPGPSGRAYLSNPATLHDPWDRPYLYCPDSRFNARTLGRDGLVGGRGPDQDLDFRGTVVSGRFP